MATSLSEGVEIREDIPLKTGKKSSVWFSCDEDFLGGSKFINFAFATLTLVITIALLLQIYYGDYQVTPHGSVATDNLDCSKIGTSILKKGGNSIDAAIASAFCLAVVTPHLTSLDAEGTMMIYNHRTRETPKIIDFTTINVEESNNIPRLVLGLAYAHGQYGTMNWKELVQPAADIAKKGFLVTKMLLQAIQKAKAEDLYGHIEPGQLLVLDVLGETLDKIANLTDEELYNTNTPQPVHTTAVYKKLKNYDIFVPPIPSIGPYFLTNLKQIEKYNFTENLIINLAKDIKIFYNDFKIYEKFHLGTSSNIAVMDLKDNYVSFVSGLYEPFGSGEMTALGYVQNIRKKNKPCTRLPLIIIDSDIICGRRIVFGVNDLVIGSQLISNLLIKNENATDSIEAARFHLLKNGSIGIEIEHEQQFTPKIFSYLEKLTKSEIIKLNPPYSSSNIVEKIIDNLNSHSDSRGGGIASRF